MVPEDLLALLGSVAQAKILAPLLDLGFVEAGVAGDELNISLGEQAGRGARQHGPLDEGEVGICKAWHDTWFELV